MYKLYKCKKCKNVMYKYQKLICLLMLRKNIIICSENNNLLLYFKAQIGFSMSNWFYLLVNYFLI